MIDKLLLISGNDIPFSKAQLSVHQPTLKEIAYIGEYTFLTGCEMLNFSKNTLSQEDQERLKSIDVFVIFLSLLRSNNAQMKQSRYAAMQVLRLLFPDYEINIRKDFILLHNAATGDDKLISKENYDQFKEILISIFQLRDKDGNKEFNPMGKQAQKIAAKIAAGREERAKRKGGGASAREASIFGRYISILAVGLGKNMTELMDYTVYQIYDELKRFELKTQYDFYIQAKLAGAKDLKEADSWTEDLYYDENKNGKIK